MEGVCHQALVLLPEVVNFSIRAAMAKGKRTHKYSVLLPTYNERENIGIVVALLVKTFESRCRLNPLLLGKNHIVFVPTSFCLQVACLIRHEISLLSRTALPWLCLCKMSYVFIWWKFADLAGLQNCT